MKLTYHKTFEDFVKNSKHLEKMLIFIENTKNISPLKENVFRFLNCNLDNLKCVILGMDPYPSTYKKGNAYIPVATGRAFEVANVEKWTDKYRQISLSVIFKTLYYYKTNKILDMEELRVIDWSDNRYINIHDWFDIMEEKGVMFLNASLTTLIGKPDSHTDIWKDFMDETIRYIAEYKKGVKWLIWGQKAYDRVEGLVKNTDIVYTCHPATRINNTFIKDCIFKEISNIEWF